MIEIRFDADGGLWLPMVICDVCEFPIDQRKDFSRGIAVWSAAPPCSPADVQGEPNRTIKFGRPAMHVHLRCEAKAKARIGDTYYLWDQIDTHLNDLRHNAGVERAKEP